MGLDKMGYDAMQYDETRHHKKGGNNYEIYLVRYDEIGYDKI
jgi:hypothetical protein